MVEYLHVDPVKWLIHLILLVLPGTLAASEALALHLLCPCPTHHLEAQTSCLCVGVCECGGGCVGVEEGV